MRQVLIPPFVSISESVSFARLRRRQTEPVSRHVCLPALRPSRRPLAQAITRATSRRQLASRSHARTLLLPAAKPVCTLLTCRHLLLSPLFDFPCQVHTEPHLVSFRIARTHARTQTLSRPGSRGANPLPSPHCFSSVPSGTRTRIGRQTPPRAHSVDFTSSLHYRSCVEQTKANEMATTLRTSKITFGGMIITPMIFSPSHHCNLQ